MTLLEVIIAMGLLSVLLVIIFGFFRELSVLNTHTKKKLEQGFQHRYVESRLSYLFSHIVNENSTTRKFYFFTLQDEAAKHQSLAFTFDNDIVLDSAVGGDVLGRLFVDKHDRFCLAVWPLDDSENGPEKSMGQVKFECFFENVHDIKFEFYASPATEKSIISESEKGPRKGEWNQAWELEYGEMPVIVKIEIAFKDKSEHYETFSFVLPSSENPVKFVTKS